MRVRTVHPFCAFLLHSFFLIQKICILCQLGAQQCSRLWEYSSKQRPVSLWSLSFTTDIKEMYTFMLVSVMKIRNSIPG